MKFDKALTLLALTVLATPSFGEEISLLKLKRISGTSGWKEIQSNKNVSGGPIKLDGIQYDTGIGTHAPSELLYAVPEGATRFTVTGGIDDSQKRKSSVVLRIEGGRDSSYLEDYATSEKLTPKNRTHKFDIKIPREARVIVLTVTDGGDSNGGDHVNWANPTFHGPEKLKPRHGDGGSTRSAPTTKTDDSQRPPWEVPEVVQINRLAPRAHYIAYPDAASATFGAPSPWRHSLNGEWNFRWSINPDARPVDFHQPDYDVGSWDKIAVPLNWQMAGFGLPIYENSTFPFNSKPPYIDQTFNPVGSYKRTFTLPKGWEGRRILIHFAGVDSAMTLWVNGQKIGYSEGSRTPAEFDITQHLKAGNNDLAVEVIRFSTGAWLEDQDFYRLSGIFRDVELISEPKGQRLQDFTLRTPLDKNYVNATFELDVELANAQGGSIEIAVTDSNGKALIKQTQPILDGKAAFSQPVAKPALWSAETPNLYLLKITHKDSAGTVIESIPWRFGFRSSEMKDGRLLVNGKPIIFAGVNRHEHSCVGGHYVTREEMIMDIVQMKRLHFNAIRTSHYPTHPEFYALCDEYGMYVNDEANIEGHGDQGLAKNLRFANSHLDRMQRMVERDKNYTSVVSWSLGNESGKNGNHDTNYNWAKANDSRPIGYQRHGSGECTDYFTPFYKTAAETAAYTRQKGIDKPMIQCEYAHAMGNSSGNLREYWDIHWADNASQGGFVWDWMDQGLKLPIPERAWVDLGEGKMALIEGEQPNDRGMRGIYYFTRGSEPTMGKAWTIELKLRTAPHSKDSFAYFPLFAKDSGTGGLFIENDRLVFQSFKKDLTKGSVKLPENFFDGGEHTLVGSWNGKNMSLYLDGKLLGTCSVKLKESKPGYLALGSGAGTALIPERIAAHAPTLLNARLVNVEAKPNKIADAEALLDIDFTKPFNIVKSKPAEGHFYAYGGYFEDRRGRGHADNFCMNGVVDSTGQPHPGGYAFLYAQQPYSTTAIDATKGQLKIRNRHFFAPLDDRVRCDWSLTANGEKIQKGSIADLIVPPQTEKKITLPLKNLTAKPNVEYRLQVRYFTSRVTSWSKAGHLLAWDEFPVAYKSSPIAFGGDQLKAGDTADQLMIKGTDFSVSFDKKQGALVSYKSKGKELLAGALLPDFWRALNDNDRGARQPRKEFLPWREASGAFKSAKLTHKAIAGNHHQVTVDAVLNSTEAAYRMIFDVYGDGNVAVKATMISDRKKEFLMRFGLQIPVAKDLTHLEWYGRGPRTTYQDRNYELIGNYSNTVDGLFTDYSEPQEYGNLSEIRTAFLNDGNGRGLEVIASPEKPVDVSARRWKHEEISPWKYGYQLPPSDKVFFNIDWKQMGVGGDNTWGKMALKQYQLPVEKTMGYDFIIRGR